VKNIVFRCGSIEAFLEAPSILRNHINEDPNFEWMRAVTPEEAQISWERLNYWAKKENDNTSLKGGSLSEWVYKDSHGYLSFQEDSELVIAETPNAVQKDWRTTSVFPFCPQEGTDIPIHTYAENLKIGGIFSRNKYSYTIIYDFALSKDGMSLLVMCKASEDNAVKPWLLAQITYENSFFSHTNLRSFFKKVGIDKKFNFAQGLEWTGGDSIDDFC
jgi:hypothetical protein